MIELPIFLTLKQNILGVPSNWSIQIDFNKIDKTNCNTQTNVENIIKNINLFAFCISNKNIIHNKYINAKKYYNN